MMRSDRKGRLDALSRRLDELAQALERASVAEYVELVRRPWRMAYVNFLAGIARGIGTAVGFAVLGAFLVYLLQTVFVRNLPWLASRIAALVDTVNLYMRTAR